MTRKEFIDNYKDAAVTGSIGTPLFPSVTMAQAILESNNGNSKLSSVYNNFFGIKAHKAWKGETVNLATGEVSKSGQSYIDPNAVWRVYKNPTESFRDRANFLLKENTIYVKAGIHQAKTFEQQIDSLVKAGYASDPLYKSKLMSIISANKLTELDKKKEQTLL